MKPVSEIVLRPFKPGVPISVPGIYSDVPMRAYHQQICDGPSVSSGGLRTIEGGNMEQFYLTSSLNPAAEPPKEKEAWIFGRAAHTLLLGEGGFRDQFAIRPETYPNDESKAWNGNSKDCKAWLAERALEGKGVLKVEQVHDVRGMADKLAAHPTIQTGLLNGLVEKSIFWKRRIIASSGRPITIWLKARPDNLLTDGTMASDLKTADDASPVAVRRAISDHGYHQQMALIREGIFATTGRMITDMYLVFQEKKAPWSINIKPLDDGALEFGQRQNERAMRRLADALDTDTWPGYEDDEVPAGLTDYLAKRLVFEAEHGLLPPIDPSPDFCLDDEAV